MRAAEGLQVEWVDDEAVVLDPETGTLHYLNPQAAVVYALILEYGSEALPKIQEMYGENGTSDLGELLDEMRKKGLLLDD